MPAPTISAVILTMGDRRDELDAAVASIRRSEVPCEIVLVWNGAVPDPSIGRDVDVVLDENVGIPAGRNRGAEAATGDLVLFLDDDAAIVSDDGLARVVRRFAEHPTTAVVAARIVDEYGVTAQRHVPRVGRGSADRSGPVALFLGGASVHRRDVFIALGGYAERFRYAMEESDLAVRVVDAGYDVWYDASMLVRHPATTPSRHAASLVQTARNRVWHAHRNLPLPVATTYVLVWLVISLGRNLTSVTRMRSVLAGTWRGMRDPIGPRCPISYRTAWTLTRLGRPPVI